MHDKRRYTKSKFNRDFALPDCYCTKTLELREFFINVLNSHAPLRNIEVNEIKEHKNGYQKNCVVSILKSILCSMNGKKILIEST